MAFLMFSLFFPAPTSIGFFFVPPPLFFLGLFHRDLLLSKTPPGFRHKPSLVPSLVTPSFFHKVMPYSTPFVPLVFFFASSHSACQLVIYFLRIRDQAKKSFFKLFVWIETV